MLTTGIIIVTHNSSKIIKRCIESLVTKGYPKKFNILVVDCGSDDGTIELIASYYPEVKVIECLNIGYAAANNVGIRYYLDA